MRSYFSENRPVRIESIFWGGRSDLNVMDTTVTFTETFTYGLFRVCSDVVFDWPLLGNRLQLTRRPLRIDVATTTNENRTRMLTYVTSPDFERLEYKSYTELKPRNKIPRFWIRAGAGMADTLTGIILLQ
ncbi:hypothetical protein ACG2F4_10120 [Halalkalibaculum sp. DA3122]|uniref:hypothetical protein n=1 Tax=Halalkalibaculum sp. DA3122 TaxID=3373607 RepID=UPI0037552B47